jgi:hypothetical protein
MLGTDLRTRVFPSVYILLRYQGGYINDNVDFIGREVVFDWGLFRDSLKENFYYGLGVGLGLKTLIGPLELFYGYGDGSVETRGQVQLSLGYDF